MQKAKFTITLEIEDQAEDNEILCSCEDLEIGAEQLVGTELQIPTALSKRFTITDVLAVEEADKPFDYKSRLPGALMGAAMAKAKKRK